MSKWRKATWALLIWNVVMILWTASYAGGIGDCADESGWALTVCEGGRALGNGLGIPFIIIVWAAGFVVFGLIWLTSRTSENSL
jgi:hypothetical protein